MREILNIKIILCTFLSITFCSAAYAQPVTSQDPFDLAPIKIFKDQARVFRISRPAATIIVGDPDVMLAAIQDLQTLVLTGKEFGTTNMIVLDNQGNPILEEYVIVEADEKSTVRVFSRNNISTFACDTNCQIIP